MSERERAVEAAKKMRENYREIHRVMYPHADEQKLWDQSTDRANIMARYILSSAREDDGREALTAAGEICERRGWNFDIIPELAAELAAFRPCVRPDEGWRPIAEAVKDGRNYLIRYEGRDGHKYITEGWFDSQGRRQWLTADGCNLIAAPVSVMALSAPN